jgi:hypothetical protein
MSAFARRRHVRETSCAILLCLGICLRRQPHCEDCAFAWLARHRDVAGAVRGIGLGEFLEQLRLLLRRNAYAGVGDGPFAPIAAVADPDRPQLDLSILGETPSLDHLVGAGE